MGVEDHQTKNITLIELPKIEDRRGNLTFLQNLDQIPFEIKRSYWLYDVPADKNRGGHAFKENEEIIIALSGSFDVEISVGNHKEIITLRRSYQALYIPALNWRKLTNFSTNALALIVSSTFYSPNDYIYDLEELRIQRNEIEK